MVTYITEQFANWLYITKVHLANWLQWINIKLAKWLHTLKYKEKQNPLRVFKLYFLISFHMKRLRQQFYYIKVQFAKWFKVYLVLKRWYPFQQVDLVMLEKVLSVQPD